MVWAGLGAGVWAGARTSLCPHVHKEVLQKRNPKNQKERRTTNEREKKSRYFLGGIQYTRGTFSAVSSTGGTFLGDIQCRRYLLGGIQCWRYILGGIESWRYFLAVSRVGVIFFVEAVKPKYGGIFSAVMQYGGIFLAVCGCSYFGGNVNVNSKLRL